MELNLREISKQLDEAEAVREQSAQASVARLLANENIHVQFQAVKTATFNTQTRVLTIPIFSKSLLRQTVSMFIGHEVGHALWSPVLELLPDSIFKNHTKHFKHYLNVAEDVRVDRKIKNKYPGIVKDYYVGYNDLYSKGFYGDPNKLRADLPHMLLVDKMNLFYKVGPIVGDYNFNDDELHLVEKAKAADSFDAVVEVATMMETYDKERLKKEEEERRKAAEERQKQQEQAQQQQNSDDGEPSDDMEDDSEETVEIQVPCPSGEGDDDDDDGDDLSDMETSPDADSGGGDDAGEESDAGEPGEDGDEPEAADKSAADDKSESGEGSDASEDTGEQDDDSAGENKVSKSETDEKAEGEAKELNESGSGKDADAAADAKATEDSKDKTEELKPNKVEQAGGAGKGKHSTISDKAKGEEEDGESAREMKSMTQENFDARHDELLEKGATDYAYATLENMPKIHDVIIPYKDVLNGFRTRLNSYTADNMEETMGGVLSAFKQKHSRFINHLVREFELKKNAWQASRASESKMGVLNLTKMHQYKFNDDLFKKITNVPQGKNHGMVMIIDLSGSMRRILSDVIEQAVVLAAFCRRVNIPFRVYGFTDTVAGWRNYCGMPEKAEPVVQYAENSICLKHDYALVEFMSEKMSMRQFNMALYCLTRPTLRAMNLPLYGTPLNEAILTIPDLVKMFRGETNAEKISVMILTDGDSNNSMMPYSARRANNGFIKSPWNNKIYKLETVKNRYGSVVFDDHLCATKTYLKMVKDVAGVNLIGYHIGDGRAIAQMLKSYAGHHSKSVEELKMEFRRNKFMTLDKFGYDDYFLLWDGALVEQDATLAAIDPNSTAKKMANVYLKMQAKKATNRTFLAQFMKWIAA